MIRKVSLFTTLTLLMALIFSACSLARSKSATVTPVGTAGTPQVPTVEGVTPSPVSPERAGSARYVLQPGSPAAVPNFLRPSAGCSWSGIAGQVFTVDEIPVTGLVVEIGGFLDGKEVLYMGLTGNSPALGPGGFEITLADHPVASQQQLFMQLFNLDGSPISPLIKLDTFNDCQKNLILVNFRETTFTDAIFLPFVHKKGFAEP